MSSEETKNQIVKSESYNLRDLLDGGTFDIVTHGNIKIPVSLELLSKLVSKKPDDRAATNAELIMFGNMIIEQRCNPYLGECWLILMKGKYTPIISAQKRVGKAQSMPNYDGYEWGWITSDGTRHEPGKESTAKKDEIEGVWCQVYFKDRKVAFFHEVYKSEYKYVSDKPMTMLLKTARDQAHKYAYANEMGNLITENEIDNRPDPDYQPDTPRRDERKQIESNQSDTQEEQEFSDDKILKLAREATYRKFEEIYPDSGIDGFCTLAAAKCGGNPEDYTQVDNDMNIELRPEAFTIEKLKAIKEYLDNIDPVVQAEPESFDEFVANNPVDEDSRNEPETPQDASKEESVVNEASGREETATEEAQAPPTDDEKWLYHCTSCGSCFDEPMKSFKGSGTRCPNCKSNKIEANE